MALDDDVTAKNIIDSRGGLLSQWWRDSGTISPAERRLRLTARNLNFHVNHFDTTDPLTGRPFGETSPFISLSAGVVSRDTAARTNHVHRARQTALWFGSKFGQENHAFLYICWVVLAPRQAVEIEPVAEEVRDLNSYRRYSPYQTEGEVVAKVIVPDNQIQACERWDRNLGASRFVRTWTHKNPRFSEPDTLSNVRELI